jgi:hypothetical protein
VGLAALLAAAGGLAANAATEAGRWPWPLETVRTHPWPALGVLTVAVVAAQLWLWWGAAAGTPTRPELTPEAGRTGPPAQTRTARRSPPRNPHFTGRQAQLDGIRTALTQGRPGTATALRGLGGVGKTQLAVEYAYRFAGDYDVIWWIDAERPALIADQLGQLAEALDLPGADAEIACAELRRRDRWLLVFDNAGDLDRAQQLLERSLSLDEARYGPDNPNIAIRLANLANVLCDRDRPAEAVPLLRRATAIDEAAYGPEHPRVTRRRAHLAAALKQADNTARH